MRYVFRNRANETITRKLEFNSRALVGMRIDELVIESWEEAKKISSGDGIRWWASCVVPSFRLKPPPE